ncbi:MAG TPA: type III-A CRISPR-associated RAMP protein Csm3 [Tenuifilaceae bacterium]|nr:type III-A CRISPR-associated RAMP protein Csm3 [Tenuifilaceae bacterium]
MKLHKKIIVTGTLELLTGLHIGDSKENAEIGGVDSPIVRRKDNNEPYIPGSSLKGKMRALLEVATGSNAESNFKMNSYSTEGKDIPVLFGSAGDDGMPSRIIIRDANLTSEWAKKLKESEFTDMPYSEIKFENVINRIKGTAEHPRQIERVPAGANFDVEFVINIMGESQTEAQENEKNFLTLLKGGIALLEDDYIGGSGTRGYGKVKFNLNLDNPKVKTVEEYLNQ